MREPRFDAQHLIEGSIAAQQEVTRAKSILAVARLDRLMQTLEKKSHKSQTL